MTELRHHLAIDALVAKKKMLETLIASYRANIVDAETKIAANTHDMRQADSDLREIIATIETLRASG